VAAASKATSTDAAARLCARLLGCLIAIAAAPAHAGRFELSFGRSWTLLPYRFTNVAFAEWIGDARPCWRFDCAPALTLGFVDSRGNTPAARLDRNVIVGAAGARAYLWRGLFFGFEVATTAGKTDALSTPYEFVSSFGWQDGHWQLLMRHISNGDFHKPNHGETMLLAGVAF
jgi:hypothetical protein